MEMTDYSIVFISTHKFEHVDDRFNIQKSHSCFASMSSHRNRIDFRNHTEISQLSSQTKYHMDATMSEISQLLAFNIQSTSTKIKMLYSK